MNRITGKSEEQTSVPDSETSVDYYVTTVNDQTPTKAGSDISSKNLDDSAPIVVSVDRAGSVKVRIRKKSKRRKKKSNLALEESGFHVSDDGILVHSSGSDESRNKMPRRSCSLSEKDLYRSSCVNGAGLLPRNDSLKDSVVRRRVKKKPSFNKANTRRRGVFLDDLSINQPTKRNGVNSESSQSPKLSAIRKQWYSVDSSEPVVTKRINRKDALATLNAFMVEVEEATTVAKQQVGERRKDPTLRKSRSLNELINLSDDVTAMEARDYLTLLEQVKLPDVTFPSYSHQKSTSFDRQSTVSGSVFISDRDNSIDDSYQHRALVKTPSNEKSFADKISAASLAPISLDDVPSPLEFVSENLPSRTNSEKMTNRGPSQSSLNKGKDFDYGLSHLEQVCKLLEQIGELRSKNVSLAKRVEELETEVKTLKQDKGPIFTHINFAEIQKTSGVTKRPHPVDRFKDALSRNNRKSNIEKMQDGKGISQPILLGGTNNTAEKFPYSVSSADLRLNERRVSSAGLRRRSRFPYSRDDLDLSSKNKWKFWKGSVGRSTDQPCKNEILSNIKAENTQGTAIHLKSQSVTLDSLLNGVDNDFGQKLVEWQGAAAKNSKDGKVIDTSAASTKISRPMSLIALPMQSDGTLRRTHKQTGNKTDSEESFRKKLNKWEKSPTQKFNEERRSSSYDRVSSSGDKTVSPSGVSHNRSRSASADFHKSLPSAAPAASGLSHLVHLRRAPGNNSSTEWNGLQKAFPTSVPEKRPLPRMTGSGHSRLTTPLRKLKNSAKRNTWSHTKFTNHVYLPNSDFMLASNLNSANSIGNQLTIQLDQSDVKSASDTGNDNKETNETSTKVDKNVNESGKDVNSGKKRRKFLPSPLAQYHAEHGAHSFRRSKQVEILRLSSCEVLASAPSMSPVREETENLHQSLPNLDKSEDDDKFFTEETGENERRFTVTVIDLKKYSAKRRLTITQSAPTLLSEKASNNFLKPPAYVQRSTSCKQIPSDDLAFRRRAASRRIWNSSNLLRSRRKTASVSSDSVSDPYPLPTPSPTEIYEKNPKLDKKRKTKTGKMFNRFISSKTKNPSLKIKVNDGPVESPQATSPPTRKKVGRIFSFRSRTSSTGSKTSLGTSLDLIRQRAHTENHLTSTAPHTNENSKPLAPCEVKQKRSSKIAEISERLTDDGTNASRQIPSPVPIKKGIVSRLSKRFSRHDKDKDEKKNSPTSANAKNENFLNAKSHFESRTNSLSKTNSLGSNCSSTTM